MKRILICLTLAFCVTTEFTACKGKKADTNTSSPTGDTSTVTAPVEVANDDQLRNGVTDATKDYPGVNAEVNNCEITLSGQIKRDNLPKLMMTLSSLRPKKINNNLTVKQ